MQTSAQNTHNQIIWTDNFNNEKSLADWKLLEIENWNSKWRKIEVKNSALIIEPKSSGWFEDNYSGFLYRELTGDFIVTARIKVEGIYSEMPLTAFSLAGLFIRKQREFNAETWRPGQENWLFFSTGSATEAGKPQFEIKTTYQSTSTLKIYPAKTGWVELRIVRLDEIFTLFYKYETTSWILLDQFIRPDLPLTLQVGITAYSDWPSVSEIYPDYIKYNKEGIKQDKGDLRVFIDWISFRKPKMKKILPIATFSEEQLQDFIQ
jgi:hypothetical protein